MSEVLRDLLANVAIGAAVTLIVARHFFGNNIALRWVGAGLAAGTIVGTGWLYILADATWATISALVTLIVVTVWMVLRAIQHRATERTTPAVGHIGSGVQLVPAPEPIMQTDDAVEAYMRERDRQYRNTRSDPKVDVTSQSATKINSQ